MSGVDRAAPRFGDDQRVRLRVFLVKDGAVQTAAVFSTRENAQAWIDRQSDRVGNLGPYRPDFDIEEVEVDGDE